MATHPSELGKPGERLRIVIIDGSESSPDFDPFLVTRSVRNRHGARQCIVFVSDDNPHAFELGRESGADICVHPEIQGIVLGDVVNKLAYRYEQEQLLESQSARSMFEKTGAGPHSVASAKAAEASRAQHGRGIAEIYRARARRRKEARKLARQMAEG